MKWVLISFFSVVLLLSVLFTAGFKFIGIEGPPSTAETIPVAAQ
ncbi:MAG TPA: hypothetical protein VGA17_13110 [Nitrospiraceae bacterium]